MDIIIGGLLILAIIFAGIKIRKDRKNGSCCGGCSGCASSASCGMNPQKQNSKDNEPEQFKRNAE